MAKRLISIVIPSFNEEKNISAVYQEVLKVWINLENKYGYEIIFVNDGSKDNSWEEIKKIATKDRKVKGINFSRNFGHQSAIEAGLKTAEGDAVIMLDGDLQHPPAIIIDLIKKWEEGFEIVNTKRTETERGPYIKKFTSRLFYSILNMISDIHVDPGSADFRLIDKKVLIELNKLTEKNKFYRGLINWVGFKTAVVNYKANKRIYGSTSYSFRRMFSLALVAVTSFSMLPLKIILLIGIILSIGGFLLMIAMFFYNFFSKIAMFSGTAILTAFIIMNNGILIIILGINSIYQISMHKELQNRPTYVIRDRLNF